MREEERQILGWCLVTEDIPPCVAAVLPEAWSPDAAFLVGLLVELAGVDVAVGPLDLWELSLQPVKGDIRAGLATWFSSTDLLLLPQYAPWDAAEVEAACGVVAGRHVALVAYQAALQAAEARREERRIAAMDRGCDALRAVWGRETEATGVVPHPAWRKYLEQQARLEAA